jgi:hypothetical protein
MSEAGNTAIAKIEQVDIERDKLVTETDTYTDWVLE